jgi:hypothetical protein
LKSQFHICESTKVGDYPHLKRKGSITYNNLIWLKFRELLYEIHKLTRKNCFRYLKLMSPLNAAIRTTISYTLWVEWYYLKNNYLTLRSKVKVPQRSLWYVTHCLMVMHPLTKYNWPIWKAKKLWSGQALLRRSRRSGSGSRSGSGRKNQT